MIPFPIAGRQKRTPFSSGVTEAHAATFLFGMAGLFARWVKLPSPAIVFGRVLFASLTLGPVLRWRKEKLRPLSWQDSLSFVILGVLLAFHWIFFFQSIKVSTVAVGLLSYSTFPVFTAILEPLLLKERFHPETLAAAALCLFGVFLLAPSLSLTDSIFRGVIWGVLAGLSFSLLSIANRKLGRTYSSLIIAFYQDATATLFLIPWILLRPVSPTLPDIGLLVILGVVCTAGAHSLFISGMKKITAGVASVISSLEPVYGITFAFLLLREIPARRTIMGGAIILASVLITSWRSRRP